MTSLHASMYSPTQPGQQDVNMGMGSSARGCPSRWSVRRCSSSVPSSMMVRSAASTVSAGGGGGRQLNQ